MEIESEFLKTNHDENQPTILGSIRSVMLDIQPQAGCTREPGPTPKLHLIIAKLLSSQVVFPV